MSEPKYHFAPGEIRYVWLDEVGDRTSPYCKTIVAAYRYRDALARHLDGGRVWSPARREPFEPQGSGLPAVRLAKLVMEQREQPFTGEEQLDINAVERLARSPA